MICMKKAMLALALALAMVACAVVVTDGSDAVTMEDGIDYSIIGETASVAGYSGDSDVVNIPAEINYNGGTVAVNGISAEAFKESKITEVIIPSSVTHIGSNAFYQSKQLEFVTIGGSATIESSAFEGCTSLKFVDFKQKPETIGERSFDLGSQNSCTYRAPQDLNLEQYGNGTTFDYINTIVMVDNWLPNFNMADQIKMDKHIPEQLAKVKEDLDQQKKWVKPATDAARRAHEGFMYFSRLDPDIGFLMRSEKYFQVTDACIGCGICTEVCPRGNYKLTSEGVKGEGDCDFCFSCIHNCPQHAIQFASLPGDPLLAQGEVNPNARYRNEHVSLWSIKNANRQ